MPELRMPPKDGWSITKDQVVASELSRAIRLFIIEEDMVSAHLLTGAARDIIHNRAKALGKPRLWDALKDYVKDEFQAKFMQIVKSDYNFFKHADRDGEDSNEYYTDRVTEVFLWETCVDYQLLYGHQTIETLLFTSWVHSRNQKMLKPKAREELDALRSKWPDYFDHDGSMWRVAFVALLRRIDENPHLDFGMPVLARLGAKPPAKLATDAEIDPLF